MNRKIVATAVVMLSTIALSDCAIPISSFGPVGQPKPQASIVTPGVVVQATPSKVTPANDFSSQLTGGLIPTKKVSGEDVIVQITGGPLLSIPQPGPAAFAAGERVAVIHDQATGRYRIVPLSTGN